MVRFLTKYLAILIPLTTPTCEPKDETKKPEMTAVCALSNNTNKGSCTHLTRTANHHNGEEDNPI